MLKSPLLVSRFVLLWLLCPLIALASFRFLLGGVAETMPDFVYHADLRPLAFYAHVVLASVALALVPFQLWRRLRARRIHLHRLLGRVYALSVVASGLGGFLLAVATESGVAAAWGFGLLAIAWVGTTLYGVALAVLGDVVEHRRWMVRSAALTMSAVTLRIYLGLFAFSGLSYEQVAGLLGWICWVPNLLFAELLLRRPAARRAVAA